MHTRRQPENLVGYGPLIEGAHRAGVPKFGGLCVLFMHEVHKMRGRLEDDFEAAFREGWMPILAAGSDARLLWYANQAHGSGPAYTVVTVTAVRDGAAWERLALRIQKGALRQWMRELDELRHDVDAKLLVALPWSPLQDVFFVEE